MIHINQDDIGIIAFFDFSNTIQLVLLTSS